MAKQQTPPPSASIGALATVALVTLLALFGALNYYGFLGEYSSAHTDPYEIGAQQSRFEQALAAVPPGARLGYLSDLPAGDQETAAFNIARYVIAPRLLVETGGAATTEWVIGDFTGVGSPASIGAAHNLRLVKEYGNGLVLYRRNSR